MSLVMSRLPPGCIYKALGVKAFPTTELVLIARDAGYDVLFIDLEHTQISLEATSHICKAAILAGMLPLVRVPHACGDGLVQRVLDGGARGIVFPHIRNAEDAKEAVAMVRFPPKGTRSISPTLLSTGGRVLTRDNLSSTLEENEASAIVMIENTDALQNLDEIASVPGLDLLLVGSMDMTVDLGILGEWDNPLYETVLQKVSAAAQRHGKLWGISGMFGRPDKFADPIQKLDVGLIVGAMDRTLLLKGAKANVESLRSCEENSLRTLN
ncbi:Pyruvate/Phosphoenolpyruvate kinase-like domain-containing protein [Aspergillus alliaceus]|uniref:Pyruvate/Phosphoenolpyruvate kinase-like domain-containing protein n=1 Tax=Petromyces alliaceus TaxID=209559 RepID=A0A5N7CKK1_PETAA|nr:Pyruvate/Phosphoenolpyruvate kinase-like domain-containing protein [Aspergillus alliaceus]